MYYSFILCLSFIHRLRWGWGRGVCLHLHHRQHHLAKHLQQCKQRGHPSLLLVQGPHHHHQPGVVGDTTSVLLRGKTTSISFYSVWILYMQIYFCSLWFLSVLWSSVCIWILMSNLTSYIFSYSLDQELIECNYGSWSSLGSLLSETDGESRRKSRLGSLFVISEDTKIT